MSGSTTVLETWDPTKWLKPPCPVLTPYLAPNTHICKCRGGAEMGLAQPTGQAPFQLRLCALGNGHHSFSQELERPFSYALDHTACARIDFRDKQEFSIPENGWEEDCFAGKSENLFLHHPLTLSPNLHLFRTRC